MSGRDEIVARFAELHPGFLLVDYENVGLPFFELRLDVMAQKRHELPVVDEYVMRLSDLGLQSKEEIGGFLGVQPAIVRRSVLSLLQADYVDYSPGEHGREVKLTIPGKTVLEERMEQVPERTELRIGFDRLLWRMSARWMQNLDNPRAFKDANARLVPPKLKRRPEVGEVDMVVLNRTLAELPRRRGSAIDQDVVQILNVSARTKFLSALLLVYVAEDESAIRASLIIDEQHSPEHDHAFAEVDGLARLGINLADRASLDADRSMLPQDLEELRPASETIQRLDEQLRSTTTALEAALNNVAVDEVADSVAGSKQSTRDQLAVREQEVERLRAQLAEIDAKRMGLPLRPIPTYEHRVLLEDALDRTQRRLLIITPWIRSTVVDAEFIANLERLCKSGVVVHIGYGIKRNDVEGHDSAAIQSLENLSKKHANFVLRELGHTHAKVLVWDDSMVVTSFNWLSFRGDRNRRYRQEEGTLIGDAKYVDREYERHRGAIESP